MSLQKWHWRGELFNPLKWKWGKIREILYSVLLGLIIVILFSYFSSSGVLDQASDFASLFGDNSGSSEDSDAYFAGDCNVAGIELHGDLVTFVPADNLDSEGNLITEQTSSEYATAAIEEAENDDKIKAILVEIDSYGGVPVAGEEIADALKNAQKPTVVLIRSAGASAAYYAAVGADRIFASRNSDVGGIGVTMSYLDQSQKNQADNLLYVPLSAGKFKDTGDPDKSLTTEEKNLLMRDVDIVYKNFIQAVADYRQLDVKKVEKLADGSTMLGQMALDNGLIDEIGSLPEVKNYLQNEIEAEVSICW